jgi:glycosyltransferase involved in cell wall biosynthesis
MGLVTDEIKCKTIQESMFAVYPWAWLPVTEAAYYKKPSIVYYFPESYERIGLMPYYVEENNTNELARAIEMLSTNEETRKTMGEKAYNILMRNEIPTVKVNLACKILENIFQEALK